MTIKELGIEEEISLDRGESALIVDDDNNLTLVITATDVYNNNMTPDSRFFLVGIMNHAESSKRFYEEYVKTGRSWIEAAGTSSMGEGIIQ